MATWLLFLPILIAVTMAAPVTAVNGTWQLLQKNVGIVAMHMQLLNNDRVVIYDRTDFGLSNLTLPNGRCRHNSHEHVVQNDCTAHSIEYDVVSNTFRALFVQSDVWCSSGSVDANGTLVQTGGYNDGIQAVRYFSPCDTCDWAEVPNGLAAQRWYATNHILPDGRQIVVGGIGQDNYEFYPKRNGAELYSLPFLAQTYDKAQHNNLYPFVLLNVDGNLFIFSNNRAILFNYTQGAVVKEFPPIPGADPRCYPSTGSAVLLPLSNLQATPLEAEVLICGGAPRGSFIKAKYQQQYIKALNTCGRIRITDPDPKWVMETMPQERVMNDMIMLPNGNVLLINGASSGSAGWENGRDPVLSPVLYKPDNPVGSRFEIQSQTNTPRMYHASAVLVRDGRVLVAGSNPHQCYNFSNVLFPTELSMEAYSPSYLDPGFSNVRPRIKFPLSESKMKLTYGQKLEVQFQLGNLDAKSVYVSVLAPPFNTHSFSMNQRLLVLEPSHVGVVGTRYSAEVTLPGSPILAPPGFYLLFVVHREIPSEGVWIQIL